MTENEEAIANIVKQVKDAGWYCYGIGTGHIGSSYVISPEWIPSKRAASYDLISFTWQGGKVPDNIKKIIEDNIEILTGKSKPVNIRRVKL